MTEASLKASTVSTALILMSVLMFAAVYYTPADYLVWTALIAIPVGAYLFVRGIGAFLHRHSPNWRYASKDLANGITVGVLETLGAVGEFAVNALIVLALGGLAILVGSFVVEWLSTRPAAGMTLVACLLVIIVILLMVIKAKLNDVLARLANVEALSRSKQA
jgi:hypothetical protein